MGGCIIQILIVEDSVNDTLLLLEELEQKGYTTMHERVETEQEFLSALQSRTWDAVVSDYVLPRFSGPDALKLLRSKGIDIPFIMVSGVYGEEAAVAMMKAGADDYIVKGHLQRFVPALEREVQSAQDRRLHKRAEGAMQYLAAIVESSEDAIYGKNLDSIIVSWNPSAERIYGYSAEEIVGRSIVTLFPLNRRDELLDIIATIRRGETVAIQETDRLHKSGRKIPMSLTVSPIRNISGEIIGASTISRDITKLKQVNYEREELIKRLTIAANQVRTLSGMLPICASCKRIRDDKGYWQQVETYIANHTSASFTHGVCPECAEQYKHDYQARKK
jgi:PAS domain S-box-containing protein